MYLQLRVQFCCTLRKNNVSTNSGEGATGRRRTRAQYKIWFAPADAVYKREKSTSLTHKRKRDGKSSVRVWLGAAFSPFSVVKPPTGRPLDASPN